MSIILRRAKNADAAAMTRLALRSKQSNGYDDAFMDACRTELTVTTALIETTVYWVAELDGKLLGMAGLSDGDTDQCGEIHAFFVDPKFKRQGIGKKLWKAVLADCDKRAITHLQLDADPAAVAFYRTLGFEITKMVPSGSISGRELPRMELVLTPADQTPAPDRSGSGP